MTRLATQLPVLVEQANYRSKNGSQKPFKQTISKGTWITKGRAREYVKVPIMELIARRPAENHQVRKLGSLESAIASTSQLKESIPSEQTTEATKGVTQPMARE